MRSRLLTHLAILLPALLVGPSTPHASAQEKPHSSTPAPADNRARQLQQSAEFKAQAERQKAEHKLEEAATTLHRALAIDREIFGQAALEVADTLALVTAIDERREDWPAATKARQEVVAVRVKALGAKHWQAADARRALELTNALRQLNSFRRKSLWEAEDKANAVARLEAQ